MQQTICDRCGKPIKERRVFLKGRKNQEEIVIEQKMVYYGKRTLSYDLCFKCGEELIDFLNQPNDKLSARFDVVREGEE